MVSRHRHRTIFVPSERESRLTLYHVYWDSTVAVGRTLWHYETLVESLRS